jgi:hypothetical protein
MFSKAIRFVVAGCFLMSIPFTLYAQKTPAKDNPTDTTILEQLKEDVTDNIPVISLDENDGQDGSTQNVSSVLSAGRDPYFNAAAFKFNAVRFRIRGYDADLFSTYINGMPMENLDNGFTPFGLWGGLNDVLRNRDNSMGLRPTPYGFGDLGGLNYIDTRASFQRKQTSINYAISNRNYTNRLMITHSTGVNSKGWAFSFSGSRRWADEGYADGTYYDGWSFFAAADKRVNSKNLLSLVVFATPTESGRQGASVQEMRELSGTNFYNPYWGYQNGVKRNASVAKSFQPFGILTHEWKPTENTSLISSVSFMVGERSVSGLDWYNAADPRPDYYRYLPSFQQDPSFRDQVYNILKNDVNKRQINWDNLYNVNYGSYETIRDANGIAGNNVSGRRSRYILEDRVINTRRVNVATTLNTTLRENVIFTAGINVQSQTNNYFKRVNDLLGGDFYVDINQFAERFFPTNPLAGQNNINQPNRILRKGDKFGFDYDIRIQRAAAWMQTVFKFKKFDLFVATEHSYTNFYRYGYVQNGLFQNNSLGKSKSYNFLNAALKTGLTYKINGRNYMFLNAAVMTRAPFFENAFIAPRTRDFVQEDITSEEVQSLEGGYVLNAPRIKLRATGYYTRFANQLNVLTFYHDEYRNFVNYAISNIGKVHYGAEFGAEAKLYKGLSVVAAAAVGRYYFNTRQNATVTVDNSEVVLERDVTVYSKNFYVPTPQQAYTLGLDYRSPKFWFLNINVNFFDQMYMDFNPVRRTQSAVNGLEPGTKLWTDIIEQTKLPSQYTVDVFAGYSWLMNNRFKGMGKRTFLVFNVGINNLLNNQDIVSGGFEQLRFDFAERDINKFPDRRFFNYGINFFASMGLRF